MNEFHIIPATKRSLSSRKLVLGVGTNDAKYMVQPVIDGKRTMCPFYQTWIDMMKRCYSSNSQAVRPTYKGCSVSPEWLLFSNFRLWMSRQDWQGKELDKDILICGNKVYSSEACVFVSHDVNALLNDHAAKRGPYPQGVHLNKAKGKYAAQRSFAGKSKHLGYFNSVKEAEVTYLRFKASCINKVADTQNNIVKCALLRHAKIFMDKAIHIENTMNNELQ